MSIKPKEIILSAVIFALGAAIYMMVSVLNDFDIAIAQLQHSVFELNQCNN